MDLSNLISDAVAAKMTPEFIEKEVATRVDKLIVESVDRALRSYSDTGIKASVPRPSMIYTSIPS